MPSPFKYIAQAIAINLLLIIGYNIAIKCTLHTLQCYAIAVLLTTTLVLLARVLSRARKLKG